MKYTSPVLIKNRMVPANNLGGLVKIAGFSDEHGFCKIPIDLLNSIYPLPDSDGLKLQLHLYTEPQKNTLYVNHLGRGKLRFENSFENSIDLHYCHGDWFGELVENPRVYYVKLFYTETWGPDTAIECLPKQFTFWAIE